MLAQAPQAGLSLELGCATVGVIEHLTGLGTPGLDVVPSPLGPITDAAQAYLLFRNHASLFDWREDLAELLLVVPLMPTAPMDDALAIEEKATLVHMGRHHDR